MGQDDAIVTRGLTRYFGRRPVVRELDFRVPRGSVVALLGLNGAGKTTTIRMLLGLLAPTRGTAHVLGKDAQQLTPLDRVRIGHSGEGHFLYPWMRIRECEQFGKGTHPQWDAGFFQAVIQRFGIDPQDRVSWLSRGQRAGVSLASTLAIHPELLILDDPALGLDPVSRRALNETLIEFCDAGVRTVLLSTHLLDDVERIADRIAIMVDGRLLVDTAMDEFRTRITAWFVESTSPLTTPPAVPGLVECRAVGERWMLTVIDSDAATESAICQIGHSAEQVDVTLEDAVLSYLGRSRTGRSFYEKVSA